MKKLILLILLLPTLCFGGSIQDAHKAVIARKNAAPTYHAGTENGGGTEGTNTVTVAVTAVSASNQCFVMYAGWTTPAQTVNTITFDGSAMTLIEDQPSGTLARHSVMYYYVGSAISGAKNVILTLSGNVDDLDMWVAQFDGVKTTDPIDVSVDGEAAGADPQEISLAVTTTGDNKLIVSGVTTGIENVTHSACDSTGQTEFSDYTTGDSLTISGGYFDMVSAGEKYQCWGSSVASWAQQEIIVALNPVGS